MQRLLAAMLLALLVAGCGGGDDEEPEPQRPAETQAERPAETSSNAFAEADPIPLTRYIARADRICARGRREARAALAPQQRRAAADGKTTPQEVMELNRAASKLVRPMVRRLTELPPPQRKRAEAERYIKTTLDTLRAIDEAVAAYDRDDVEAANEALRRNRKLAFESANAAGAVGLKACGTEFGR